MYKLSPDEILKKNASPRKTYRVFDIIRDDNPEGLLLEGSVLRLPGKSIKELLAHSERCILMAVTLGIQVDQMIKQTQERDFAESLELDRLANEMVEKLCDSLNDELEQTYQEKGFYLTDRFSPGYGDLPLEINREICQVLDTEKTAGITVGSGGFMSPLKSITAVIGISNIPEITPVRGCVFCRMKDRCILRELGKTCMKI